MNLLERQLQSIANPSSTAADGVPYLSMHTSGGFDLHLN